MQKIAFISDIHSNPYALEVVLADIKKRGITKVYCLGDSTGYFTQPNQVIDTLKQSGVVAVLGNHDETLVDYIAMCKTGKIGENKNANLDWIKSQLSEQNKTYLEQLPKSLTITANDHSFLLNHGSPNSISEYVFENDDEKQTAIAKQLSADAVVFGHTHLPYIKEVAGKLFINAGSVGKPKGGDNRACYVVATVETSIFAEIIKLEYDVEKMATEIENSHLPNEYAQAVRNAN